jgi:predicted  nucleic acid-binding Zn-ribbon protein
VSDLDKQVAAVKADIARAQAARARAEHEYQVAKAQAEAAARDLKEEFGVASPEAARIAIDELEAELEAECTAVREALSRAGRGEQQ